MSGATFFVQDCPVCGRYLQVRLKHLGKQVACPHCKGTFIARDPSTNSIHVEEPREMLLDRADELLSSVGSNKQRPR